MPEPNADFVSIHVGAVASCGIKTSGETVCWSTVEGLASNVPDTARYTDLVIGGNASLPSCGLTEDGVVGVGFVNPPALNDEHACSAN